MNSWPLVRLDSLYDIARGGSPRPIKDFITEKADGINWVKISDATASGKYIFETNQKIIPEGIKHSRYVKKGDFILSNSMSFGRPYIMATSGCIHDGWLVLSPKDEQVNQDFLYYILGSPFVFQQFDSLAAGSTVRNLNIDLVSGVKIPLLPLEEQKRIVAILDQAFADIDQARATAETNLKNARELFDSYLQQVFSQRGEGWVISKIGEVAKVSYGYTEKAVHEKVGPHFLRITDIQDGYVDWTKVPYCTISETDYKKYKLMTGDIVFARTGATTGKSYLLDNPPESVAASYLIRLRLTCKDILPEYISLFFQTTSYWDNVKTGMTGSAQGGFNASKLSDLILAYPRNIERQIEICNELASLESHIQMLKAIYTKKLSLLNDLKKSILQTAFAGELTKSKGIAA